MNNEDVNLNREVSAKSGLVLSGALDECDQWSINWDVLGGNANLHPVGIDSPDENWEYSSIGGGKNDLCFAVDTLCKVLDDMGIIYQVDHISSIFGEGSFMVKAIRNVHESDIADLKKIYG
jgi:hypothetical protein